MADVQVATSALQGFGELLQGSTSIQDLGNNAAAAQKKLDDFDTAIAKLGTYKLAAAQLDKQRAGLVATGPAVSDVLRRFVTAAAAGDIAAVTELLPEVQRDDHASSRRPPRAADRTPWPRPAARGGAAAGGRHLGRRSRRAFSERLAPTIAAVARTPQKTP